jgi:hypothetical protein
MKQAKGHLFALRIVWIGMYEVWHFVWERISSNFNFRVPCILFGRDHSDRRNIVSMEEMGESLVRGAFRLQRERHEASFEFGCPPL